MASASSVAKFVYKTMVTGVILLLPLIVVSLALFKIVEYLVIGLIQPLLIGLNNFLGMGDSPIWVGITLLVLAFFLLGLLVRVRQMKMLIDVWETKVLSLFPGYRMVKSITRLDDLTDDTLMKPAVLIQEGSSQLCFLVETKEMFFTIFLPEAPNVNAGNVVVVPAASVRQLEISNLKFIVIIRDYGLGAINLIAKSNRQTIRTQ